MVVYGADRTGTRPQAGADVAVVLAVIAVFLFLAGTAGLQKNKSCPQRVELWPQQGNCHFGQHLCTRNGRFGETK